MTPRCNFHTHTNFCDGKNTAEEMVTSAINLGCTALGFSGHSYLDCPNDDEWTMSKAGELEYIAEISRLKNVYADRIELLLGIEQDYFSQRPQYCYDYVIGSVHAVVKDGVRIDVDLAPDSLIERVDRYYGGDVLALVKDYYALVADVVNKTDCDIIGHFDLITKFSEKHPFIDTSSNKYRSTALEAVDALTESRRVFEINTGAISRGWRKMPYPEDFILKHLAQKKADIMLNSDAHSKDAILCGFNEATEYARACGIKELCVFENKELKKIKI